MARIPDKSVYYREVKLRSFIVKDKEAYYFFAEEAVCQPISESECIELLRKKYECLGRYPKRSDMSQSEVVAIKAHLGPWPRALERAGIKVPRDDDRMQKNREKRIRAKQNRIKAMKEAKKERTDTDKSE